MFGVLHHGYGSRHTRQHSGGCMPGIDNAIVHYYDRLRPDPTEGAGPTEGPSFELPDLDDRWREFFAVSSIAAAPLHAPSAFDGLDVVLLDLMGNPRTRTTKTNPSLLMVARAVVHVTSTGRPLTIVTPSSANKATALRDAVLRAYECGLVSPEELNVVCLVPPSSVEKIWSSPLATHAEWARRNPVLVLDEGARSSVKQVVEALRVEHQQGADHQDDATWWFTMQLDNYTFADRLRAWFETDHLPADGRRWHSHAVSSAFGLLGHARGTPPTGPHPGYLLVQHLATPDMVLHLRTGSFDRAGLPRYDLGPDRACLTKDELVARVVARYEDRPIVLTTGYVSRIAYGLRPGAPNHFYMVGSMGMAAAIARGVSSRWSDPERAPVVLDGDGAVLMGLHGLLLEQETTGCPILHLVADDAAYASTGSQAVPSSRRRIRDLAGAAGYARPTLASGDGVDLERVLDTADATVAGGRSTLVQCLVRSGEPPLARVESALPAVAEAFGSFCRDRADSRARGADRTRKTDRR